MAQKTQIVMTDDLDGSEATQTITFAYQGTSYEIDLNDEHTHAIEESFSEWVGAARKISARSGVGGPVRSSTGRASSGTKRTDLDDVRAWARDNGHTVADRGRIKQSVLDAYDARG